MPGAGFRSRASVASSRGGGPAGTQCFGFSKGDWGSGDSDKGELGEKGEVYHSAMAFHHQSWPSDFGAEHGSQIGFRSPPFQEKLGKLHEEHRKQLIAAFQEQ